MVESILARAQSKLESLLMEDAPDGFGKSSLGVVGPDETFLQWCDRVADAGLRVDGKPFSLADRAALVALYAEIPSTIQEANRQQLIIMKGAQLGLSCLEMLATIYLALKFAPATIGCYMPDSASSADKSQRRFLPIIRSIPDVYRLLTTRQTQDGRTINVGDGNVMTRLLSSINSAFLFMWSSSQVGTESRPLDVLSLDEVQAMTLFDIAKTAERLSASSVRYTLMLSTANVPDSDIHFHFLQGTQHEWHTLCEACGEETPMARHWPACCQYNMGEIAGAPMFEWCYVCVKCNGYIPDTQRGRYIAANPTATVRSYHISQIVSPTITARDMMLAWQTAATGDLRRNFWCRKLGIPYVDSSQLPVSMADCLACVEDGKALGLTWQSGSDVETYAGIDQMGGHCCMVVKRRLPDGRQVVVHAEEIYNIDPFERCAQIITDYRVAICVLETLPNFNDAKKLAQRFRGRVYLAQYAGADADAVSWGDAMTRSDRKTAEEDRLRYTVNLQQYKAMSASLARIKNRHCLFPDDTLLEQDVLEKGERLRVNLCRDRVFKHFTRTALVVDDDPETRKPKPRVVKVGLDPHWSFAFCLADVALARNYGMSSFILPEATKTLPGAPQEQNLPLAEKFARRMPGLPQPVLDMLDKGEREGTCGSCINFSAADNQCTLRFLQVSAAMTSCDLYDNKAHYQP